MSGLNWGMIQNGGAFESLMHALLYAEEPGTILFGRSGKDAGQDARSADGTIVYQAKYGQRLNMDGAITLALAELETIKKYRQPAHPNHPHWQNVSRWILVANFSTNPNNIDKWADKIVPIYQNEGLIAEYWHIETLEGKLAQHPEIRDVFFGGENRILVGLKEAHDLLTAACVGSASFAVTMVGRDTEIGIIKAFAAADDKCILPVVGPGGIGKSRLLYESLVALGHDGWRVLWALPGAMSRSSQWFKLLNGSQKTCVVIDNPEDPGLLGAIIEQLITVERRNWRVLVACRTENAEVLRRYRNHCKVEEPLVLKPLDEPTAKQLLNDYLSRNEEGSWLHSAYKYTRGNPGWLCLIAELRKQNKFDELPTSADEIASLYLDSSLGAVGGAEKEQTRTILRWLSLWGTLALDTNNAVQLELVFLERKGVPVSSVRGLLKGLVAKGLVRNWGVGKRMYAVEPMIIREHVLSSWLLECEGGTYRVSAEGKEVVAELIGNLLPQLDKVLNSLSCLSCSRLNPEDRFSFLHPVFADMERVVREESVVAQYVIVDFVEKVGAADPERALDVLTLIRQTPKADEKAEHLIWCKTVITHSDVLEKIPWILFEIAEQVDDIIVARRFLEELREFLAIEVKHGPKPDYDGKSAQNLLNRLLCKSKKSSLYAQPAREAVDAVLAKPQQWSQFEEIALAALMNPQREWTEWSSDWTITFVNRVLTPQGAYWQCAYELRANVFKFLRTSVPSDQTAIRQKLWRILAETHHVIAHVIGYNGANGSVNAAYGEVLRNDLSLCLEILKTLSSSITLEEATCARELWKWYLEYGSEEDPVDLAKACEEAYNGLSSWRMQDFYKFGTDEVLNTETERVCKLFLEKESVAKYQEFFDEALRYLKAARQGGTDLADGGRISELADACADRFAPNTQPANALTNFVIAVLAQGGKSTLEWSFAVRNCKRLLLKIKREGNAEGVTPAVISLLDLTQKKAQLLFDLYSNAHPNNVGKVTDGEFELVLARFDEFTKRQWFGLLGVFAVFFWNKAKGTLETCLEALRDDPDEASACMWLFLSALHMTSRRYKTKPHDELLTWILEAIVKYGLNGSLLEMYDLTAMRDETDFRLSMRQLLDLVRSRVELEKRPKPSSAFAIVPHNFKIAKWCRFDAANPSDMAAFYDFCRLAIDINTFVSVYWMPKYVAQIDPSGVHVGAFVYQHLCDNPDITPDALARLGYLVSAYPDDAAAWAIGARHICDKASFLAREQREQIYYGIGKKEISASCTVGNVADCFYQERDKAARMVSTESTNSSLRPYWEWKLRKAEADLEHEKGWVEEVYNA